MHQSGTRGECWDAQHGRAVLTISAGAAVMKADRTLTSEMLIKAADDALYRAKDADRARYST